MTDVPHKERAVRIGELYKQLARLAEDMTWEINSDKRPEHDDCLTELRELQRVEVEELRAVAAKSTLDALNGAMRSCNVIIFSANALDVEDAYRKGYEAGAVACRERIRARKEGA